MALNVPVFLAQQSVQQAGYMAARSRQDSAQEPQDTVVTNQCAPDVAQETAFLKQAGMVSSGRSIEEARSTGSGTLKLPTSGPSVDLTADDHGRIDGMPVGLQPGETVRYAPTDHSIVEVTGDGNVRPGIRLLSTDGRSLNLGMPGAPAILDPDGYISEHSVSAPRGGVSVASTAEYYRGLLRDHISYQAHDITVQGYYWEAPPPGQPALSAADASGRSLPVSDTDDWLLVTTGPTTRLAISEAAQGMQQQVLTQPKTSLLGHVLHHAPADPQWITVDP